MADEKATPAGGFAFRLDDITKLVGALRVVLSELVAMADGPEVLRERCEATLEKAKLKPEMIRQLMKPFGKISSKNVGCKRLDCGADSNQYLLRCGGFTIRVSRLAL